MRPVWLLALGANWALAAGGEANLPRLGMEGLLTTAGGLAIVLALILGTAWVLKRVGHLPSSGRALVKVLGGVSLGTRERVVVVEVDEVRLVLGVTPGRVQTLHVLPPGRDFGQALEQAEGSP